MAAFGSTTKRLLSRDAGTDAASQVALAQLGPRSTRVGAKIENRKGGLELLLALCASRLRASMVLQAEPCRTHSCSGARRRAEIR
jgi:hypothetical protein